ncbi:MAG TPA: lysophospholipid acyltransferase family protein [Caulobacteraceae bacterium]
MKTLLRSRAVQTVLALLAAGYLRLLFATLRWRYEDMSAARAVIDAPEGMIILFWHGRLAPAMASLALLKAKPRYAMVSLSRDGAFIARAAEWVGAPTIRGSMAKAPTSEGKATSKGGAHAFWRMLQAVRSGAAALLTPDGPRGPSQRMSLGAAQLAKLSGAPVMLCGFAASPAIAAKSWDNARFPLPFGRCALVAEGPLWLASDADEAATEAARADWEARLNAAQARAEALLG